MPFVNLTSDWPKMFSFSTGNENATKVGIWDLAENETAPRFSHKRNEIAQPILAENEIECTVSHQFPVFSTTIDSDN